MAGYKRRRRFRRRPRRFRRRLQRRFNRFNRRRGLRSYVDKIIRSHAEKKYLHWNLPTSFGSINTSWTELNMSSISSGTDNDEFIGREYRIKKIYFYGYLQGGQTGDIGDDANNFVRIIVAHWSSGAGLTPCTSQAITLNTQVQKNLYPQHLKKKYFDRLISLTSPGVDVTDGAFIPARKKIKYMHVFRGPGLRIRILADGAQQSRLFLSMLSDSGVIPNPGFVSGHIQMQYYDV